MNPVAIYEAGQGFKGEVNDKLIINDDIEIDFGYEYGSHNASQSIEETEMDQSIASDSNLNKSDDNESQLFSLAKRLQTTPVSKPSGNSSSAMLLQITEMRSAIQEKKLAIEERKLTLEEKRIDQEFKIKKMELEVRKIDAENSRLQLTQQKSVQNWNYEVFEWIFHKIIRKNIFWKLIMFLLNANAFGCLLLLRIRL